MVRTREVATLDGRKLELHEAGPEDGFPVIAHHGTPGSGLPEPHHTALAEQQGIRLVSYDRPGCAGSGRAARRSVADCAADVAAIADQLGVERFATWGISGGGPHALACGALCDERLVAAAVLGGVGPYDAPDLDWFGGMGDENLVEFRLAAQGEEPLRAFLEEHVAPGLRAATVDDLVSAWSTLLGDADRAALSGTLVAWVVEAVAHGIAGGLDGYVDDMLAFVSPWGFEVEQIGRPLLVVHGADDRFVPVAHAEWLLTRVPHAEAWLTPTDGHFSMLENRMHDVNDWLRRQA
jgi:pimeloyl-ACP methyl ester carboxylesterase